MTDWERIKEFYRRYFGIEGWVVELYANLDLLQLCASGASNKSILNFCDIEEDDLVEILMNTFQFPGWSDDLPCNPYKLYNDLEGNYREFYKELKACNVFELRTIKNVFTMCKAMKEIEERIQDEWI